jgi:uncharacterized protein (TIGR02996 family)
MPSRDLEALLAEIRAAPDDDAPRLVFADALTEAGDPWGELIVAACELSRLDGEPSFDRERYDALDARCGEIQGRRWREKALRVDGRSFAVGTLDRGFCRSLVLPNDGSEALMRVQGYEFALLRELSIEAASESGLATLARWPLLPDLTRLSLRQAYRASIDAAACEAALKRIAKRAPLSSLSVHRLVFDPAALSRMLASLHASLRELEIDGNGALAGSLGLDWPALDRLALTGLDMTASDVDDAIVHAALDQLASLDLSHNPLGDDGIRAIIDRSFANLRALDVRHTELTGAGLHAMARAPLLRGLTSLAIGNGIYGLEESDPPIGPLSVIAEVFDALTELELDEDAERPEDVVDLVRRLRSPLRRLRLRVGAHAVAVVAQLVDNPALADLRELDLSDQRLGDRGAILLANAELRSLEDLDLSDCEIGRDGARALAQSRTLPHTLELNLFGNPACSPESLVAALQQRYRLVVVDRE